MALLHYAVSIWLSNGEHQTLYAVKCVVKCVSDQNKCLCLHYCPFSPPCPYMV